MPSVLVTESTPIPTLVDERSLAQRLAPSRGVFERVRALGNEREVSSEQLDVVEEVLLRSDVGVLTTNAVLEELRTNGAPEGVAAAVRSTMLNSLRADRTTSTMAEAGRVPVWRCV